MKLSRLNELPTTREMIDVFGGYNHNLRIREGEFYDMTNLTSDNYPVLSPRPKRGIYTDTTNPQGMISKDSLCYVDGKTLYINKAPITDSTLIKYEKCDGCPNRTNCNNYKAGKEHCEKTMISMGAYIIIMPDKVYYNTENPTDPKERGNIEEELVTTSGNITFALCKADGTGYENLQSIAPSSPSEGDLWLDQSSYPTVLKQYSKSTGQWSPVATTYVKMTFSGYNDLDTRFSEGDGVAISGIRELVADKSYSDGHKAELSLFDNTMVVNAVGNSDFGGYIVVKGIISESHTIPLSSATPITVSRTMPYMDYIIESQNRLWGCRYGIARNGQIVNEIYASKLGDFKNWDSFAGISTDSYVASVGTDGQFTGAVTHMGYPIFFKETCMHKVYGNFPSNYQIQTTACRGVQKGCSKSLAIVNETLFYKARSAVCAYDGSLPAEISSEFGEIAYENAVAGSLGNKYYISMADSKGKYHLFVYDAMKGMWHKEDDLQAVEFCNCRGNLYFIDYADEDKKIKTVRGTGDSLEPSSVRWMATTGYLCTDSPDKKYISRLTVRLALEVGTRVHFSIEYDSLGTFEHLYTMTGTSLRSFSVPIKPKRCDHMRLKIEGDGEAKIFSICKTIEQGSDM